MSIAFNEPTHWLDDGDGHVPSLWYTQESSLRDPVSIIDLDKPFSTASVPSTLRKRYTQCTQWHSGKYRSLSLCRNFVLSQKLEQPIGKWSKLVILLRKGASCSSTISSYYGANSWPSSVTHEHRGSVLRWLGESRQSQGLFWPRYKMSPEWARPAKLLHLPPLFLIMTGPCKHPHCPPS